MALSHTQYEVLEQAIARGQRVALVRRGGTDLVIMPERIRVVTGREALDARHPSTGDPLMIFLDELDTIESVPTR